jgi:hypothetical protein
VDLKQKLTCVSSTLFNSYLKLLLLTFLVLFALVQMNVLELF